MREYEQIEEINNFFKKTIRRAKRVTQKMSEEEERQDKAKRGQMKPGLEGVRDRLKKGGERNGRDG